MPLGSVGDVKEAGHRTWQQGIPRSKAHVHRATLPTWHQNNSCLFTSVALIRKVVRTYRCYTCSESISSRTSDFLKMEALLQLSYPRPVHLQFSGETGEGATSKCAVSETIWGVQSECCDVAELSTALPPQVLLPWGQIPFWLTADSCWHCLRRCPAQTTSFGSVVVSCWATTQPRMVFVVSLLKQHCWDATALA